MSKPGINLIKIDSETFEPLVNAKFLIKLVGGSFAKEYTTDASGEISLSELDPGAYTVEEITAPDGYLIDDAIRTIQINAGENAQFVFTNTRKPVLEVLKFDGENYLPGATFRIAKIEDGSHYLDRITDMNGKIRIDGLEPGIYSVKELQPPPGYLPNDTEFHVELFPGRISQLVVNNVRKPDLCIVKTDANTGLPIEGVTYTVRKVDSSTLETVKTDKNGEAWMYLLDEGVYEITEQSVPPTHLLDTNKQLITLVGGRTGVVRFQNYPRPKLQILKVDVITGERLPNAEFRVSKVEGSTVSEYITDASGEILIENLDVAIYRAEEFMPPDGYIRYDESKQIQLQPGNTSVLKFDNIRKPTLIITKTNGLTYEPIPNTTYKIEYEQTDGGIYPMGTYKTDANGQIVIKNASVGWYIITETIPAPGMSPSANPVTRKYLAPGENAYTNAFLKNAGTEVTTDIIFLQKRDRIIDIEPEWVHLGETENGIPVNSYFAEHPDMMLGTMSNDSGTRMYGAMNSTSCVPFPDADLSEQLADAITNIHAEITEYERGEDEPEEDNSIPANPTVRNFSYTLVDGQIYYRQDSRMVPVKLPDTTQSRVKGMIKLRECVRDLIMYQTEGYPDSDIQAEQSKLNRLYDDFTKKYGLINSRGNSIAFSQDSAYCLLCSLEVIDENGELERKADMFQKRTIRPHEPVTHVDTASEALAVSMSEKARVDLPYMAQLSGMSEESLVKELEGVIFFDFGNPNLSLPNFDPEKMKLYEKFPLVTADEYRATRFHTNTILWM